MDEGDGDGQESNACAGMWIGEGVGMGTVLELYAADGEADG
jgi:hypothetical protein